MTNQDVIDMARRCAEEIKMLRRINAELAPKADAYDALRTVLNLMPRRPEAMGEDLVWRLEKQIADLIKPKTQNDQLDEVK